MNKTRGFSLVELLYTIAVAGLLMAVGVPTFTATMQNGAMTASTNSIVTALLAGRSEAVKRRVRVTVCPAELVSGNPACAADGTNLLVFTNTANDATFNAGAGDTVVQFQQWVRGKVTTTSTNLPGYISYLPSGYTRLIGGGPIVGDLVFCDARGNSAARVMSISATGRPQVRKRADVPAAPACPTT